MDHYYSPVQTSKLILYKMTCFLRGRKFEISSASGIFSAKSVDCATELLISNAKVEDGWEVLDLGCGCGVVGVVIAATFKGCKVVMSDVNKRAIRISKMNVDKLNLNNAEVIESDIFSKIDRKFDTILLNPPMVAGRETCFKMIEESKDHLNEGGLLQIVARHNKGGKMLKEKMKELFGNVEETAKRAGFRVYVSKLQQ